MNNIFYNSINKIIITFTCLLINILAIKIKIKYKTKKFYKLAISNHVSELDILLLFIIFLENKIDYRLISDDRFQNYPVVSQWASQNKTIFVNRADGTGCESIKSNTNPNDNVFIFPEGTLFYKPMIDKSNQICKENNIKKYKNVLCPKTNGFNTLKQILKPKYITNITLKYIFEKKGYLKKSIKPLTIFHLFTYSPEQIVIYIGRTKLTPYIDINEIFRQKDKLLNN